MVVGGGNIIRLTSEPVPVMTSSIQVISITHLMLTLLPVLGVLVLLFHWSMDTRESLYGLARMLVQLLIIGYFLVFLFEVKTAWIILAVLTVMILASSWIALRTSKMPRKRLYGIALVSTAFGGGVTFVIVTQGVLALDPWYAPRYAVPLAGMVFGGAMTAISLAAERFETEILRGASYEEARNIALKTALIPITNSLFAVGLVSLPGMMTGQILSGVSPLTAVRYQIMVMCMLFASAGLSAGIYLHLLKAYVGEIESLLVTNSRKS